MIIVQETRHFPLSGDGSGALVAIFFQLHYSQEKRFQANLSRSNILAYHSPEIILQLELSLQAKR